MIENNTLKYICTKHIVILLELQYIPVHPGLHVKHAPLYM